MHDRLCRTCQDKETNERKLQKMGVKSVTDLWNVCGIMGSIHSKQDSN